MKKKLIKMALISTCSFFYKQTKKNNEPFIDINNILLYSFNNYLDINLIEKLFNLIICENNISDKIKIFYDYFDYIIKYIKQYINKDKEIFTSIIQILKHLYKVNELHVKKVDITKYLNNSLILKLINNFVDKLEDFTYKKFHDKLDKNDNELIYVQYKLIIIIIKLNNYYFINILINRVLDKYNEFLEMKINDPLIYKKFNELESKCNNQLLDTGILDIKLFFDFNELKNFIYY